MLRVFLCVQGRRVVIEEEVDEFSDYLSKNLSKKAQPGKTGKNFQLHHMPPDLP